MTKTFMQNLFNFLVFGFKLYERGVCDKPIKGKYKLIENSETYGYNKVEASKVLGLSTRQFDRKIKQGLIPKGMKIKGETSLYWDKDLIDKMSDIQN